MTEMSVSYILAILAIGVFAGFLSSLVGIGGGVVIVPALVLLFGLDQKMAQGTSLAMLSPPDADNAPLHYYQAGNVTWTLALLLAVTFVVGVFFGSKIAVGLEAGIIKKVFAVFMIVIAIKYLFFDK